MVDAAFFFVKFLSQPGRFGSETSRLPLANIRRSGYHEGYGYRAATKNAPPAGVRTASVRRGGGGGKRGTDKVLIDPKSPAFSHEVSETRTRRRYSEGLVASLYGILLDVYFHCTSRVLKQGDDLVAALDAVRAEEGHLGASRITSCGYFLQSSVCQNAKSRRPHPKLC